MKRRYSQNLLPRGTEIKSVDRSDFSDFFVIGSIKSLVVPEEGSSFYNRIGRETRGLSLHFCGWIKPTYNNAMNTHIQALRYMILYDRQPNGSLPTVSQVLLDYAPDGNTSTNVLSGINMNNKDRFVVLRDRKLVAPAVGPNGAFTLDTNGGTTAKTENWEVNDYLDLNGLQSNYQSSNGSIGDVTTGSFILLTICADEHAWEMQWHVRFRFKD